MTKTKMQVSADVEVNEALHDAYVSHLEEAKRGGDEAAAKYFAGLIERAGNYDYDGNELMDVLMTRAGFGSAAGNSFSDFGD